MAFIFGTQHSEQFALEGVMVAVFITCVCDGERGLMC